MPSLSPEPSPPPTSTADAFTATRFHLLAYRFPFMENMITFGNIDLSLRLAGQQSSECSPSHDYTSASTSAIKFESDSSNTASSHPVKKRLSAASHPHKQRPPAASHPHKQRPPAASHPRQEWPPAASQVSPPTPQHPSYPLSTAASSSSPPSLQHPYPRPLPPRRYSLVPAFGTNSSTSSKSTPLVLGCVCPPPAPLSEIARSSASFPNRRLSDSAAMRLCISRSCGTPEATLPQLGDIDPIRMEPLFSWVSKLMAGVRSLEELRRLNITKVKGRMRCNRCGHREEKEYEIEAEFNKLAEFVVAK